MREYKEAEQIAVSDLLPYSKNAKTHDAKQIKNIAKSIEQYGFTQPLVIDADNTVIIGHGRLAAAKLLGLEEVPCIRRDDLTEKEVRELRILDNKLNESPWDTELLTADLDGLEFNGYDLEFEIPEEVEPITAEEDDFDPDYEPEEQRVKPGQIWMLGEHRLLCGDSTDGEALKRLCGGQEVDAIITDPPYNVDVEGTAGKIANDNMPEEQFVKFLTAAFHSAEQNLKKGGAFYVWYASSHVCSVMKALEAVKLMVKQELVWVKNTLVLGRSDYQWMHEPCLYGWKPGEAHYFAPTRRETSVFDDTINTSKLSKTELRRILDDILYGDEIPTTVMREDKPLSSDLHPTMKPIKLMARQIRNSTKEGEIVLDPFGGSGSTLMACEQMRRRCFTVELDPHYAQCIIDRWEDYTGEEAVLLSEE